MRALGLLVMAVYVASSFAVGTFYPFSVFDMYSRHETRGSRVVVRAGGEIDEVDRFVEWSCEGPIDLGRCGADAINEPVDRELAGWIAAHPGTAGAPVELLRRTFSFAPDRVDDCVLARCRAVRR